MEFRDLLCTCYNVTPFNLQIHCAGCGTAFEVRPVLICSKGVLVIECHNNVCVKSLYLTWRVFTSALVRAEPLIHQGCTRSEWEILQGSDKYKETCGDVIIQILWDKQAEATIDFKRGAADVDYYKYDPMAALLDWW